MGGIWAVILFAAMWASFPTHRIALCLVTALAIPAWALVRRLVLLVFGFQNRRECPACHMKGSVVVQMDAVEAPGVDPGDDWVPAHCKQCKKQFRLDAGGTLHDHRESAQAGC